MYKYDHEEVGEYNVKENDILLESCVNKNPF